MVGFGHGFWIDSLRACKFFNWDPALRAPREFTVQEQTQRSGFPFDKVGSPIGAFQRIKGTLGGWVVDQDAALVWATTLCQEEGVNCSNMSSCQYDIHISRGKTNKEIGSADNSGGVVTCSMNKGLSQGSMSL